ncbi:MAG: YhjD/YihY/BrkB family envelope integrity protein [Haloglomus sp.]
MTPADESSPAAARRVLGAVVEEAREERVGLVAAGLAYNLLLLAIPLALLALLALESTGKIAVAAGWLDRVADRPISTAQLKNTTGGEGGWVRAVALAGAFVVWSALRTFRSLSGVFAEVYGESTYETWTGELLEVVVVLATSVGALALVGAAALAFAVTATDTVWFVAVPVLLFGGFFLVFFPVYYVFPPVDVAAVDVLPGPLLAAAVLTLSGLGIRLYAEASVSIDLYGVVGATLLFLTWLYVGGLALLVGVVLNAVLGGHLDSARA